MHQKRRLKILPLIQWHEGMFLGPQHLQQQDLRLEQILSHQLHLLSHAHYGVHHLQVDPVMLASGIIRILVLEAVMPDGLIVNFVAGEYGKDLECDLKHHKEHGKEVLIQLILPERLEDRSSVTSDLPRYLSVDGDEIKDDNIFENPVAIPRLLPKLSLHMGDAVPKRCLALPLLKVGFIDDIFIKKNYIPPCFFITKDMPLWQELATIAGSLRSKASYLCEKWQNQIGTPMLQETSAMLRPLMASLPEIETVLHSHPVNPFVFHQILCRIAGHVSTIRLSQLPPVLPPYHHGDILGSLMPVIELIQKHLASLEQTFMEIPFQQKDRLFYLRLHDAYASHKLYVGLRAAKGMSEGQLSEWMSDAIITSDSTLEMVRVRRITGTERTLLEDEDLVELMPSRGVLVFEVKANPEYVHFDQNLHIFNPADTLERRPTEIVLYVRNRTDPK